MLNKQPQVIDSCSNRTSNCLILDGPCMLLHVMQRLLPFVQTSKTTNWAVLPIVGVYRYSMIHSNVLPTMFWGIKD